MSRLKKYWDKLTGAGLKELRAPIEELLSANKALNKEEFNTLLMLVSKVMDADLIGYYAGEGAGPNPDGSRRTTLEFWLQNKICPLRIQIYQNTEVSYQKGPEPAIILVSLLSKKSPQPFKTQPYKDFDAAVKSFENVTGQKLKRKKVFST